MRMKEGVGKELAELPEQTNRAGERKTEQISDQRARIAHERLEAKQCMENKERDGCAAKKVHAEIERLPEWCLGDQGVQDEHRDRCPSRFQKELPQGKQH